MTTPKKIAGHADLAGPDGQNDIEAMLKSMRLAPGSGTPVQGRHCGLVAIVGKPNVGKSTLLNALVGQKISITSRKAQTTRHRITGMRTQGANQFVFVDTPGFQTLHANALNKSLNKTVVGAIPTLLIANKLDNVHRRGDIAPWLQTMQEKHSFAEFVPMSAKNAKDIERLLDICAKYLPEQAWWYAEDELTDRSEKFLASELVREKLFRLTGDELPYTSTVIIDKFEEEPPQKKGHKRLLRIAATIVVERDSHKAMVIGDKGERIKRIGMETRVELEKLADAKVFLELCLQANL